MKIECFPGLIHPHYLLGKISIFSQVLYCERNPLRKKKIEKLYLKYHVKLIFPPPFFFFLVIILKKKYVLFVPYNDQDVFFLVQVILLDVWGRMTFSLKLWSQQPFISGNINAFLYSPSSPSALTTTGIVTALRTMNVCWGKTREKIWWRALYYGQKKHL